VLKHQVFMYYLDAFWAKEGYRHCFMYVMSIIEMICVINWRR